MNFFTFYCHQAVKIGGSGQTPPGGNHTQTCFPGGQSGSGQEGTPNPAAGKQENCDSEPTAAADFLRQKQLRPILAEQQYTTHP